MGRGAMDYGAQRGHIMRVERTSRRTDMDPSHRLQPHLGIALTAVMVFLVVMLLTGCAEGLLGDCRRRML